MATAAVAPQTSKKTRQANARQAFIAKMNINMAETMRELGQYVRSAIAIGITLDAIGNQQAGQRLLRSSRRRLTRMQYNFK